MQEAVHEEVRIVGRHLRPVDLDLLALQNVVDQLWRVQLQLVCGSDEVRRLVVVLQDQLQHCVIFKVIFGQGGVRRDHQAELQLLLFGGGFGEIVQAVQHNLVLCLQRELNSL